MPQLRIRWSRLVALPLAVAFALSLGLSQVAAASALRPVHAAPHTPRVSKAKTSTRSTKTVHKTAPGAAATSSTSLASSTAQPAAAATTAVATASTSAASPAGAAVPSGPIPLGQIKLLSYMPAGASWTNMWTQYQPSVISADFGRVAALGANTVRLVIDPTIFGFPSPSPVFASELYQTVALAQQHGLKVQLTLFDWWSSYSQTSASVQWADSLLYPYRADTEVAFVEVQNEIDPTNPTAMAWARDLIPAVRQAMGNIPVTISTPGQQGVAGLTALQSQLGTQQPDFYDYHYYGVGGAAASVLAQAKAAASPRALFVGETGLTTYSASPAGQSTAYSAQAAFFANLESATAELGLPPAAPWMLNDLYASGVPAAEGNDPTQLYYGLYDVNGNPKPAAAVVQTFFTTGEVPLLLNTGFESAPSGVPTGWIPSGSATGALAWDRSVAHSGTASVSISGSGSQASWTQVANTGPITTGEELQATVWAQGSAVTGYNVIAVSWFDADNDWLGNSVSPPLPQNQSNWTELGADATAPAGAAFAVIYLQSSNNSGKVWFDDAAVTVVGSGPFPALPPVPVTSGVGPVLTDTGFETAASGVPAGWSPSGPGTGDLAWDQTVAHSGSASVSISGSGSQASWTQTANTGPLSTGEEFHASVWAQGMAVTGSNVLAVSWFDANHDWLGNAVSSPVVSGTSTWTYLTVQASAPAGAAYAVVYLQSSNNSGTVWFDDVAMSAG